MTTLYAVFREGVQRHECGGIFDTLDAAKSAARSLIVLEPDDYHSYCVVPFVLNETTPFTKYDPDEPDGIFCVQRNKHVITES